MPPTDLETALEEILTSRERGQPVNIDDVCARFPDCAEELRRFMADGAALEPAFAHAKAGNHRSAAGSSQSERDGREGLKKDYKNRPAMSPSIGGYRLLEEIGSGSQGVVYKAEQPGTRRIVAVKVIRDGVYASTKERLRFENEIQVAAKLKHPNIVSVFECDSDNGRPYFAMEYAKGDPLDFYLSQRTLSVEDTVRLLLPVCEAVSCAHQAGVIHRDLKPANILVDDTGMPHLLDFGLAKHLDPELAANITQVGSFAGTWYYASPEQAGEYNLPVDVRSDVYSLGVILYEALTDSLPYAVCGAPREEIARVIRWVDPIRPSAVRRDLSGDLETIILCALNKDPTKRYQSTAALAEDLRRFLSGDAIEARRDSRLYLLRKTLKHYRAWVAAIVVALLLLLAFTLSVTVLYTRARTARATLEARAEFNRLGEKHILDRLSDLHVLQNIVDAFENGSNLDPLLKRLRKPTARVPIADIENLIVGPCGEMLIGSDGRPVFSLGDGREWLQNCAGGLDRLRGIAESHRLSFVSENASSPWIIQQTPADWYFVKKLSEALATSSLVRSSLGHHADAMQDLEAARSLALDLGDGPTFLHKGASLECRQRTYRSVLFMLEGSARTSNNFGYVQQWLLEDPPLPTFRYVMVSEGLKASQVLESAITESTPGGPGQVDLPTLDRLSNGLYTMIQLRTPEMAELVSSLRPRQFVESLDAYSREVESQSLPEYGSFAQHSLPPGAESRHLPGMKLINPLLPNIDDGLRLRSESLVWREAAHWAVRLCAYRAEQGSWPETLMAVSSQGFDASVKMDGLGGHLHYEVVNDVPRLTSTLGVADPSNGSMPRAGSAGPLTLFHATGNRTEAADSAHP